MNNKLVCGVGLYLKGKYVAYGGGKNTLEYCSWVNMLQRCYSEKLQDKHPTYVGCCVSDNFKDFQYFAEWCNRQVGFGMKDFNLDKDLLYKGNKQYSESTCAFVPKELNSLLLTRGALRGSYPVGVCWCKRDKKFRATLTAGGKNRYIGLYDTVDEAFAAYKEVKEAHVRDMANKYKGVIDIRVYDALMNWRVDVDD